MPRRFAVAFSVLVIGSLFAAFVIAPALLGQKKKKGKKGDDDSDSTQTLPVLPDPPGAIPAETGRLMFHVAPLSANGLLSQQLRDSMRALIRDNHGAPVVKIRAFVAGTGDMRRVQSIVSEVFTERKQPLPVVSTIQVGALPMEAAQVALESISMDRKIVNPNGLAFFSGQQAPNVRKAVDQLQTAVSAAGVRSASVLRATCFLSSIEDVQAARAALGGAFPAAAANYVQLQRLGLQPLAECEAVGRLDAAPAAPVVFLNPPGLQPSPNYTQVVLVNAPKLVISGTQMSFRDQESDIRLAFERLRKAIEPLGVTYKDVFWASTYPLTRSVADRVRDIRFDFLDHEHPPASTMLLFEGLPSMDATVAFDVMAASRN